MYIITDMYHHYKLSISVNATQFNLLFSLLNVYVPETFLNNRYVTSYLNDITNCCISYGLQIHTQHPIHCRPIKMISSLSYFNLYCLSDILINQIKYDKSMKY